jgi:hypothetical protein
MMRFLYFYLMGRDVDRIAIVAPRHARYWSDLRLPSYVGGPFADRSGGLITFEANSDEAARALVGADPFMAESLLERSWLKSWLVE